VKKELRPVHDHITCEVCGRTLLKGERTEAFLAPGGQRHTVCELCLVRAEHAGWLRESAHGQAPARGPRPQERRSLLGRLRRHSSEPADTGSEQEPEEAPDLESAEAEAPASNGDSAPPPRRRERPQNPRHVRAVPTTVEAKLERALGLFNESVHQRTVAGLARSLGEPWVTARPDPDAPSAVIVLVAWELSWYRYRVDLGDATEPVAMQFKGDELDDIDESLREWNAGLDSEGRLVIGVASG